MSEALMRLPLSKVDSAIGWDMPWLDAMLTYPEPNGYWTRHDLTQHLPKLQLPALATLAALSKPFPPLHYFSMGDNI